MIARLAPIIAAALLTACLTDSAGVPDAPDADAAEAPADVPGSDDVDDGPAVPVKQILFGDLHVHSTHSVDAALLNAPILGGRGLAGPALRCDYARFCSQLDFWSINDHPEGALPSLWDEAREAIRVCNDLEGGDGADPSMVSFLGWEWTQSATSPASNYGHKNVIFKDTLDEDVPARPVAAPSQVFDAIDGNLLSTAVALAANVDPDNTDLYETLGDQLVGGQNSALCESGVDTRALPADCREVAEDPAALYEKLDQWGFDALVIPHGTTWGVHNPARASWADQLTPTQHDPEYERLVEIYSGHGAMEPWRPWVHALDAGDGTLTCPAPSDDGFEACCWRAGEIIRGRDEACLADSTSEPCEVAVAAARLAYLEAGMNGVTSVGESEPGEWGECGQCLDCFQPAFTHRPGLSTQAALAETWFGADGETMRYHWGFIGSTDSHRAGAGAGYKEDVLMSDVVGPDDPDFHDLFELGIGFVFTEWERQNAYFYSGGLVAVHSDGRDRGAVWDALKRREVYATSGDRMLLWFELLDGDERLPMGAATAWSTEPTFEVRAVGSHVQAEGCPEHVVAAAPEGFIESACLGECYHPLEERNLVTRIEVVKITPQISDDESLDALIHDPWLVLECEDDPTGCVHTFSDPDFVSGGRPASYYVRAIQAPTLQLNAENLRCERDEDGACVSIDPCVTGYLAEGDDCKALDEERAWSSPVYLHPAPAAE